MTGAILDVPAVLLVLIVTAVLVSGIRQAAAVNTVIVGHQSRYHSVVHHDLQPTYSSAKLDAVHPSQHRKSRRIWLDRNRGGSWSDVLRLPRIRRTDDRCSGNKNGSPDVPISVIGSLLICMILYVLVSLVLTGVVNYKQLNVSAPVVFA